MPDVPHARLVPMDLPILYRHFWLTKGFFALPNFWAKLDGLTQRHYFMLASFKYMDPSLQWEMQPRAYKSKAAVFADVHSKIAIAHQDPRCHETLVALRPLIIPEAPETKDKAPEIKGKAPETKGKAPKVKGKVPPQLVPPQVRMRKWTDSPEVYSKATSSKEEVTVKGDPFKDVLLLFKRLNGILD